MRILLLSDTHGKHKNIPKEWLVPADVIIHAGDISNMGYLDELESFYKWYDSLDYTHKIFIAGNHDWGHQTKPKDVTEIMKDYPSITYLEDSSVTIDGVEIFGSPWQPEFYNWSFNLPRGEKLQEKWDAIPKSTSILVTHGPVAGILDMAPDGRFVGCENLLETIKNKLNIKMHVCGHIHCAAGNLYKDGVLYVNAATLNERYTVQYRPTLVDYDTELGVASVIEQKY